MPPLVDDATLERSAVVANCRMNRERVLRGSNGYDREIGFDPVAFLREHRADGRTVAWLDLCCGSGCALIEAAREFAESEDGPEVEIIGIDLAGMFREPRPGPPRLRLVEEPLRDWVPGRRFDLITCVHGLHYLGDKLGAIARAVSWLETGGRFVANLDPANLRFEGGAPAGRAILAGLRKQGLTYQTRRRLLRAEGPRNVAWPGRYLGADDTAGPNVTGQPAVDSYYAISPE